MPRHESKICPHCHNTFVCKSGDIVNCQCESVQLSQQHRDYIFRQYEDCLCACCMRALRSEFNIERFNLQMQQLMVSK